MAAYSMDLRQRAVRAMQRGELPEEVGRRLEIHPTTLRKWRRRSAAGRLEPQRCGARPVPTKLTAEDIERMRQEVEARPGVTLRELVILTGNKVVESTICRALMKLGYRYKKSHWLPANSSAPTSSAAV